MDDRGLTDVAEGRVATFDAKRIIARGGGTIGRPLNLRIPETAELDLAEIWSYLAEEASESFATELLSRIEARFNQALSLPLSGAPCPHLAPVCVQVPTASKPNEAHSKIIPAR